MSADEQELMMRGFVMLALLASVLAVAVPVRAQSEFANAEALLRALETADEDLRAFRADIRYVKTFEIAGEPQVREGALYYRSEPGAEGEPDDRRFAVEFDSLRVGRRLESISEVYTFDGQWLVERNREEKSIIKRRVVPPGETFDPLRIGEGPMPIPIGQRADEVLARYDATLVDAQDGLVDEDLRKYVRGSWQLKLVPKPEYADRDDFTEIRLWYDADSDGRLLPRASRTVTPIGDVAVVLIKSRTVRLNDRVRFPPDVFDVTLPDRGWDVQILEWRGGQEAREGGG